MEKDEFRPEDKLEQYSYILCYLDDIFCINHDPDNVFNELNRYVPLKPNSVKSPWSTSQSKYIQEAIRIFKEYVVKHWSKDHKLPKRAENPFKSCYYPELDMSLVLGPDKEPCYQSLIGIMRWRTHTSREKERELLRQREIES